MIDIWELIITKIQRIGFYCISTHPICGVAMTDAPVADRFICGVSVTADPVVNIVGEINSGSGVNIMWAVVPCNASR